MKERRVYTAEFKQEAVRLCEQPGASVVQIATELGVSDHSLYKWLDSAFSGEGARLAGGRWNARGIPMVYLASSLSLAALDRLAHTDDERTLSSWL